MDRTKLGQQAPTYLLDKDYYPLVDKLAREVQADYDVSFYSIITNYMDFINRNKVEHLRTRSEYGLELLYIGILYDSYVDHIEIGRYQQLKSLSKWLASTNEFNEIVRRLEQWLTYWSCSDDINQEFDQVITFTEYFIKQCNDELKHYTYKINDFIEKARIVYKDRDDYVFVTRHKNDYYINMIGAQILNNIYREDFKKVDQVYIFLPGCMAIQKSQCKAVEGKVGYRCSKCTPNCPINLTEETGLKYNAKTSIVFHSSELYNKKVRENEVKYGVVGIACVLSLLSGGLRAKELGYIPQCVLLDYSGCKQHWDFEGLVTDIDLNRLEHILI